MMLFDVVHKINGEISRSLNNGMPGPYNPKLFAATDGQRGTIHFLDKEVWNSETWEPFEYSWGTSEDEKVRQEMKRIEDHIKREIHEYIILLYKIEF